MTPDLRGCEIHGPSDFVMYKYKSGRVEKRCLACRREKSPYRTRNNGNRCRRGHLRTPWTWRLYSGIFRCMPCHSMKRSELRQKKKAA